ncbi:Hint domain-containing protein [Carnimonas nigrificans]|uniref:Hint domain-containing protein n=1 Tax=Carnimonas nigrificans TaxID=64323 RepID=UPI0009FCDF1A|nr:Hint domain-containing protein [Carnimonas nigrificans]
MASQVDEPVSITTFPGFSDGPAIFNPVYGPEDNTVDIIIKQVGAAGPESVRYCYAAIRDINAKNPTDFTLKLEQGFADKYYEMTGERITCFTKGTLVSTPTGEVAVETLKEGDEVITLSGVRKVEWLGIQPARFRADFSAQEKREHYPVHILPGALGNGVPTREVVVSAWHHLHINGVLVRAMDIINGNTIYQDDFVERIDYYHVEFDTYDMIATSGMFSESFTDNGNTRGRFINADSAKLADDWQNIKGRSPRPGFKVVRPGDKDEHLLFAIREQLELVAENALAVAC